MEKNPQPKAREENDKLYISYVFDIKCLPRTSGYNLFSQILINLKIDMIKLSKRI